MSEHAPATAPENLTDQQLTPEQAAMLREYSTELDSPETRAMLAQMGQAAIEGGNTPYGEVGPYAAESPDQAVEQLAEVESHAINAVRHTEDQTALELAQQAQQNRMVEDARHTVEEAYGKQVAAAGVERGISESMVVTKNSSEIAQAVVDEKPVLASADESLHVHDRDLENSEEAQQKYTELKDKVNGRADTVVGRVADRTNHALRRYGMRKKRDDLRTEAVAAKGANLTSRRGELDAEQELVGEAVVAALADNRPNIPSAQRKELLETVKDNPGSMRTLGEAVRYYRHGGRKAAAFRKTGKLLGKLH